MDRLTLPIAEDVERLLYTVETAEGRTRVVGGAVRDALIGRPFSDLDLATEIVPEQILALLKTAGIRAVPTGLKHGTVTAVLPSGPVEVTTLRRDMATDGRHAVVAFTDDWREDAARRDFTINALYADPLEGRVFDYFGGRDDLAAGRVRFIGAPLERIAEDHLRILRFFRFHARYGRGTPDEPSFAACVARANDLMALSRERIADEVLKLLVGATPVATIALMVDSGILRPVLPEIDADGVDRLRAVVAGEAAAGVAGDAVRRLAALVPARASETVGARLRLSKVQRARLIAAHGAIDGTPEALGYRLGAGSAIDRLLVMGGDARPLVGWTKPVLPITGGALIGRGLTSGPEVARVLRAVEAEWIAAGFPERAQVDAIADRLVDQALAVT